MVAINEKTFLKMKIRKKKEKCEANGEKQTSKLGEAHGEGKRAFVHNIKNISRENRDLRGGVMNEMK
jgi:hypothetical protein